LEVVSFFKSFIIGIAISAPIGATGALVIRRTLEKSSWLGVTVGLGACVSDTLFAFLALWGSLVVQDFIRQYETPILLVGGTILLAMGVKAEAKRLVSKNMPSLKNETAHPEISPLEGVKMNSVDEDFSKIKKKHFTACFFQGFFLTAINPLALFGFLGLFVVFNLSEGFFVVLSGVFLGALSWWVFLAQISRWMRKNLSETWLNKLVIMTNAMIFLSAFLFFGRLMLL
jgi:arginine exporter protein ArgO